MYEEAKLAGKYTHQEWQKQEDHLKIVTLQEILDGKRIDLFLLHTLTKKASSLEADKKQKSLL